MMTGALAIRTYTAAEVDAAVEALRDPQRFAHAQDVVTHAAPGLQRILNEALAAGGWFGPAHQDELERAAATPDAGARLRAVGTLVAEETRLGMLVGVAVGFELAHELQARRAGPDPAPARDAGVRAEGDPDAPPGGSSDLASTHDPGSVPGHDPDPAPGDTQP